MVNTFLFIFIAASGFDTTQLLSTMPTPVTPKPDLNRLLYEDYEGRTRAPSRAAYQDIRFHWKVDMELRAIYDLMLDEQKESLHDRVVSQSY